MRYQAALLPDVVSGSKLPWNLAVRNPKKAYANPKIAPVCPLVNLTVGIWGFILAFAPSEPGGLMGT